MGGGGGPWDDAADVEAQSGRSIDEFRLVGLEFWTWTPIGAVQATYRSVIDGRPRDGQPSAGTPHNTQPSATPCG